MNGHAKMGLELYRQPVSRGAGRGSRVTPTARITCRCRWVAVRHAPSYKAAQRLAEIALECHLEEFEDTRTCDRCGQKVRVGALLHFCPTSNSLP